MLQQRRRCCLSGARVAGSVLPVKRFTFTPEAASGIEGRNDALNADHECIISVISVGIIIMIIRTEIPSPSSSLVPGFFSIRRSCCSFQDGKKEEMRLESERR